MNFSKKITNRFNSILLDHCFELTSQSDDRVMYENDGFYILFFRDPRERTNSLWVGSVRVFGVSISDVVIKDYFGSEIEIESKPIDDFISGVFEFFSSKGMFLLQANEKEYLALEKFSEKQNEEYTAKIVEQQYLNAANKAWKKKNYVDVIKNLNQIDENQLPRSFKMKYKIARKMISD